MLKAYMRRSASCRQSSRAIRCCGRRKSRHVHAPSHCTRRWWERWFCLERSCRLTEPCPTKSSPPPAVIYCGRSATKPRRVQSVGDRLGQRHSNRYEYGGRVAALAGDCASAGLHMTMSLDIDSGSDGAVHSMSITIDRRGRALCVSCREKSPLSPAAARE